MPVPTGDFSIDYTALANTNPYNNASFTQVDTGNVQILSAALKPSGFNALTRFFYNGTMLPSATIRAKVEVGVAHISDNIYALVTQSVGSGYGLRISNTSLSLLTLTSGGVTGGLTSATLGAIASGDIITLELVQSTHTFNCYQNGSIIGALTTTDSTYTTGLAFGIGFDPENNNTSTALGFAGDGIVSNNATVAWII